jgi:hypothetical protein
MATGSGITMPAEVQTISGTLTAANRWDHFLARCGVSRSGHRVEPGLYALGGPTPDSPVLVTANYTLSFDALRAALAGSAAYLLVLDTRGINVWCAAGKGTFGTDELVQRIEATGLADLVRHRTLILPQLGAPGVAAHEVEERSGFQVEYGPIRAADLPEYLDSGQASAEMRQVRFGLRDRLVLIPVELRYVLLAVIAVPLLLWAGILPTLLALAGLAALTAGLVIFPILLPWLPTRDFSSKGLILGGLVTLPFALATLLDNPDPASWRQAGGVLAYMLIWPPVTAYLALNFTGSTTFTSRSGVRREIFTYIPIMASLLVAGIVLEVVLSRF